jgi:UDP-N-acetylglucosamine acyltransferase
MASIHPTAVIEDGAAIGEESDIGPHVVIFRGVTLGPRCRVHAGAVIGDLPQDLAFREAESFVRIGADCVIREHVTIHRGTKPDSATVVGDGCMLMANSHLGHNVRLGARVIIANGALLGGYVDVGDGVFISGNVVIHQFVRIGRLAMLSGNCGIGKDVPPFAATHGVRRNEIAGLNVIGMRRAGFSAAERLQIKRAFAILYRAGLNAGQAVERIRQEFAEGPARELAEFVAESRRGICPMAAGPTGSADDSDESGSSTNSR